MLLLLLQPPVFLLPFTGGVLLILSHGVPHGALALPSHLARIPVQIVYQEPPLVHYDPHAFHSDNTLVHRQRQMHRGIHNLDEKVQLSPYELRQVGKHLPVNDDQPSKADSPIQRRVMLLHDLERLVDVGFRNIRHGVSQQKNSVQPSEDAWKNLNATLRDYFRRQYEMSLRQDQPPTSQQNNQIFESIMNAIQNFAGIFMQNITQINPAGSSQAPPTGTAEDEQTSNSPPTQNQNPFQVFYTTVEGGLQQIIQNIQNYYAGSDSSTPANVQSDTGEGTASTSESSNVFVGFVNQISNIFSGDQSQGQTQLQIIPGQNSNNNNTTTTATPGSDQNQNPGGFFQSVSHQITQIFNWGSTTTTTTTTTIGPPVKEDEGSESSSSSSSAPASSTTVNPIFGNIPGGSQLLGGGNPFVSGLSNLGSQTQNFLQSGLGQNGSIGTIPAFGTVNNFATQVQQFATNGTSGSNPLSGAVDQLGNALNPQSSTAAAPPY